MALSSFNKFLNRIFSGVLFLLSLSLSAIVQDRTINLNYYSSANGLSDNQVTSILRDKQGYIWAGTKDGLNRFDGKYFTIFRHIEKDSTSLCGNNVTCLAYDNDSILWIGTASSGLCSYNFRTQKFTTYNKNNIALPSNSINAIAFDKYRNVLWLGLNNSGLQVFDIGKKKLMAGFHLFKASYYDIAIKDSTAYVAGTIGSLKKIEPSGNVRFSPKHAGAFTINKIFQGSDGHIWCGAWDNALHEFNDSAELLNSYIFDGTHNLDNSADEIICIAEDTNKILWCGTKNSGLLFFDLEVKSFTSPFQFSIPFTSRIQNIYRDDHDRMWIATEQGLFMFDPLQNQFNVTKLPVPEKINCIVYDRHISVGGTEYIASACGLFYKNRKVHEYDFKEFRNRNEKLQLTSIFNDDQGNILIGTNKTIFILDTINITLSEIPANPKLLRTSFYSVYSSRANSMDHIRSGGRNLTVVSYYGQYISLIDLNRKNIFWLSQNKNEVIENLTRKIFVDSKNRMWICGATFGISEFILPESFNPDLFSVSDTSHTEINVHSRSWRNQKPNEPIAFNDVYDIFENPDGSFWLTTQGSGLVRFFPEKNDEPLVPVKGDFQSLQGIAAGSNNDLWMISSRGLVNFNISNHSGKLYDSKHGIPAGIAGYFFNDNDSLLSAGFDGGFVTFNPLAILKDREKPQVHLTKLWVMDVASDSLLNNVLELKYDKNFLKFYLASNCFSDNSQVTYMYRLAGIDDDWRSNGNNPLITYTSLPAGNYELSYKAINSDGIESAELSLAVIIVPPFHKTVYFYLLVLLAIGSAIYGIYKYRISHILKLQEVRNKIARDLHDDIGSTLGSINLYSEVASSKLKDQNISEIESILKKIINSSREIIDKTSDAVWVVKATNDTFQNLLFRMESHAASLLGTGSIRFSFEYDAEKLKDEKLEMNQRKNIFLIYKEALNNIIKYADCTEVIVKVEKSGNNIFFNITDNGKGFNTGVINPYNGNGIGNMKSRAKEINAIISIISAEGKGTCVELKI